MDNLFITLLNQYWFVIPIFIVLAVIKTAWFKGLFGEFLINLFTQLRLDKNDYHLIKNVTLPTDDGTTQIDHIIVSKYGIFVVETKNMKGWIFGSENQKSWTQKIYRHTSKFQNPLHQNYKHVKTLESLLEISGDTLFPIVVFIGDSTFKTDMPVNVFNGAGYLKYINSKNIEFFSDDEVAEIIQSIESGRLERSIKTNRQHVSHVNDILEAKKAIKKCPKCGSSMVLRKTKKGKNIGKKFWGCSQFPKCRGVLNQA